MRFKCAIKNFNVAVNFIFFVSAETSFQKILTAAIGSVFKKIAKKKNVFFYIDNKLFIAFIALFIYAFIYNLGWLCTA